MAPRKAIIPVDALSDRRLRTSHLRALLAIGHFADRNGRGVRASGARLAKVAGLARSTFLTAVNRLSELGYIRRNVRRGGRTTIYEIVYDSPQGELPLDSAAVEINKRVVAPERVSPNRTGYDRMYRAEPVRTMRTQTLLGTISFNEKGGATRAASESTTTTAALPAEVYHGPNGRLYRRAESPMEPLQQVTLQQIEQEGERWRSAMGGKREPPIPT